MFHDAAILDAIGQAVWRASWQASGLAVAVLAAATLLRGRLSPAWRYGLWAVVLARLLLPTAPQARWSAYTIVGAWDGPLASYGPGPVTTAAGEFPLQLASNGEPARPTARPATIALWRIAASVWLAGVVAMIVHLGCRARRLRRAAAAWPDVADRRVLELLAACQGRLRLQQPVRLCVAPDDTGPAVLGVWRPRIVLPEAILEGFSHHRLEAILLHELAHIRRRDVAVHWLMTAARVLHWFNPIAWLALSRMAAERELACDDVAIDVLGPSSRRLYGETMLRLLERRLVRPAVPGVVHFFGPRRRLQARLESLVRPRERDRSPKLIPIALSLGLAVFGLFDCVRSKAMARGVAAIDEPRGQDQAQGKTSDREERLYKRLYEALKKEHEFNDPRWPFLIKVRDVAGRTLIDATFKHRVSGKDEFDLVIQARKAELHVGTGAKVVRVFLEDTEVQHYRRDPDVILIQDRVLEIPVPPERGTGAGK
jgi:beta-lactamase regulating signal transducer with metallopeptidase domain